MKEIKKILRLPKIAYFETHLSIINCILPKKMTPTEIKVMAAFMCLEGDVAQYRFGPTAKKIVMNVVNPEKPLTPAGLSNHIGSLIDKGFLLKSNGITTILPILMPEEKEQLYMFKLQNLS